MYYFVFIKWLIVTCLISTFALSRYLSLQRPRFSLKMKAQNIQV